MSQSISSHPASGSVNAPTVGASAGLGRGLGLLPEVSGSLLAGALILLSYRQPWWSIRLYAPQYPKGLGVDILLTGPRGDVRELDTLNHYIGMASLTTAAPLERQLALLGIAAASVLVTGLLLTRRRTAGFVAVAAAAAVPLGFVADCFYWLHLFGHHLNPHAPLRLAPFTPALFGNGTVGQFMTFARPELGFWLVVAAAGTSLLLVLSRARHGTAPGKPS